MRLNSLFLVLCLTLTFHVFSFGRAHCEGLFPIPKSTVSEVKWGYIDCQGRIVVEPKYEIAYDFEEGIGVVLIDSTQVGTNNSGHAVFELTYGVVSSSGQVTVLPNTRVAGSFSEGLMLSKKQGQWSYIDKRGESRLVVPASVQVDEEAPEAFAFKDGLAGINTKEGIYHVTRQGKFTLRKGVLSSIGFLKATESVLVEEGFTVIDKMGRRLIKAQKNPISFSQAGFFRIETEDGKWKYLNSKGKTVLEVPYNYAGLFNYGLALVQINGKWGYMNKKGVLVIPPKFEDATDFTEGTAWVKVNNNYGFIMPDGKFLIQPKFEHVHKGFYNGLAYVQMEGYNGYINKKGEWIWRER